MSAIVFTDLGSFATAALLAALATPASPSKASVAEFGGVYFYFWPGDQAPTDGRESLVGVGGRWKRTRPTKAPSAFPPTDLRSVSSRSDLGLFPAGPSVHGSSARFVEGGFEYEYLYDFNSTATADGTLLIAAKNGGTWTLQTIADANVSPSAGIAASKLALAGALTNASISPSAAIDPAKINFSILANPTPGSQQPATAAYAENYTRTYADAGDAATLTAANLGTEKTIEVAITHGTLTFSSTTPIPIGAKIRKVMFVASTAFDANTKVTVGTTSHSTDFVASTDNFNADDAAKPLFMKEVYQAPTSAGEVVLVTLSQTTTVGAGVVAIEYAIPQT